jgi:tetratricopeptide (TPR) repeat protein
MLIMLTHVPHNSPIIFLEAANFQEGIVTRCKIRKLRDTVPMEILPTENPVIQLCIEGARAEFERRLTDAHACYVRAWELAQNDFEACIAAHYVARGQSDPADALHWNQVALRRAQAAEAARVAAFWPSLYLSLGGAYATLGDHAQAQHYFEQAAGLGFVHQQAAG